MGEIAINPTHNVHKKYRKVNLVNPYIFAPPAPVYNTEIGGIAATISTASALAAKLGISVGAISNFTIVGSDIKCKITGSYGIPDSSLMGTGITYYKDYGNLVSSVGYQAFRFEAITELLLPYCVAVGNAAFQISGSPLIYIPRCTSLGSTVGNNSVFSGNPHTAKIYVPVALQTINAGSPDGDATNAISNGGTVRYVANFTAPNQVTTLTAGTIYNTSIQLNFTPPSGSTNAIDYYELYNNGILQTQRITASGQYVIGLTASTNYNFTLISVDVFYNKSIVSNNLSVMTNTTSAVPTTGLVSYYRLDSNSSDSFSSNNGTDTSISYVAGKFGNAASFNGTTSKIATSVTPLTGTSFTISFWIKMPSFSSPREWFAQGNTGNNNPIISIGSASSTSIEIVNRNNSAVGLAKNATVPTLSINTWYHFVWVCTTNQSKLYLNGTLYDTTSFTANSGVFNTQNIGVRQRVGYDGWMNGVIDELSIHSIALSQAQIDSLYNSGNGVTL